MMKHPEFDQMVALAERLRLELDSSDRKNLVGSQSRETGKVPCAQTNFGGYRVNQALRLSSLWRYNLFGPERTLDE